MDGWLDYWNRQLLRYGSIQPFIQTTIHPFIRLRVSLGLLLQLPARGLAHALENDIGDRRVGSDAG
jgi:hypothetical protein